MSITEIELPKSDPTKTTVSPRRLSAWMQPYVEEVARQARTWYDADGNWISKKTPEHWGRDRMWMCDGIYPLDPQLCDAVARHHTTPNYRDHRYNVFTSNIAACVLMHHRERMSAPTRADLESLVRESFHFKPGSFQPDYQFHGFNDNFPAMATMGLALGAEMFDDDAARQYALWNLRQVRAILFRRGTISEFNSPTYTSICIHSMAAIAEHVSHPETRQLARSIEERLWIDFAARFHPTSGLLSGPYSRAYTSDFAGTTSMGTILLWCAFGDQLNLQPNPTLLLDPPSDYGVPFAQNYPYEMTKVCYFGAMRYHVPDAAKKLFFEKTYPFRAVATAETGGSGDFNPGRTCRLETFQHEDYSVGTNDTPMLAGQQAGSYIVTYRRTKQVKSFRDVGLVYTSIVMNDQVPGQRAAVCDKFTSRGEEAVWHNFSNSVSLQHDSTAMHLSHPDLGWGGSDNPMPWHAREAKPIHSLSEMVIFPSHCGGFDELMIGGESRTTWSGDVPHAQWIACRRGRMFIAIRPMAYTRTMGRAKITLEKINDYEIIRSTFYQGEPRAFTTNELRQTMGGFVAEHASVDEFPSLAAFASYVAQGKFTDYLWMTRRARYRRAATAQRPAVDMEFSYQPGTTLSRYATINGVVPESPRVQIDGIAQRDLPFLNEPFKPNPGFFPWKDFTVEWADWDWAINDREEA